HRTLRHCHSSAPRRQNGGGIRITPPRVVAITPPQSSGRPLREGLIDRNSAPPFPTAGGVRANARLPLVCLRPSAFRLLLRSPCVFSRDARRHPKIRACAEELRL